MQEAARRLREKFRGGIVSSGLSASIGEPDATYEFVLALAIRTSGVRGKVVVGIAHRGAGQRRTLQRDWTSVSNSGDSAGGNFAAATAIACRDAGIKLAAQLLVYPVTDVAGGYADASENARFPSRAENADGYFLSRAVMEWFCGHYLADPGRAADWRVSALRAPSLAGVAPAIVTTACFDPLRDEGVAYARALEAADVRVKRHKGPRLIHGYFGLGDASEVARTQAQRARADFKALLAGGIEILGGQKSAMSVMPRPRSCLIAP